MRFEFGRWLLDTGSRELTGEDGPVALSPKEFALLEMLLLHHQRAVSKPELHAAIWPDTYVSESSLKRLVSELRATLGDEASAPTFIRTVHGHGYRFAGEVKRSQSAAVPARQETRTSVAVMPFIDMSPERDQGYFCEGLAEEIIASLIRIEELRVAPRSSSFQLGSSARVESIGESLRVAYVLAGSVRRSGERVRVNAQLIDSENQDHLWSESFDRSFEDVFAIQDEIAASTAEALAGVLTDRQREILRRSPTHVAEAWDYYLQGRQFFHRKDEKGFEFARRLYNRAIELDPSYARAYAGIADCCSFLYSWWGHDPVDLGEALASSQTALELAPDLAEVHAARGLALSIAGRGSEAETAFQTGMLIDPRHYDLLYFFARARYAGSDLEAAAELFEQAASVEAADYQALFLAASAYQGLGKLEESINASRRGLERAERQLEFHPDDARALYLGGWALVLLGEVEHGLEWATRARNIDPDDSSILWNVSCIYTRAGRYEEALELLERICELGFGFRDWFENDPDLDPLREHPRFLRLLEQLKEREGSSR